MDYDFLNNYLNKITDNNDIPDDEELDDENDFYNVPEQEDENDSNGNDNSDDYSNDGEEPSYGGPYINNNELFDYSRVGEEPNDDVRKSISSKESQGKYSATNKHSSATGKYQFLWSAWGDSIKKVTGVKNREEFLNNPKAQETYYSWYEKNYLMPQVKKLQPYNKAGLNDQQLARLVHYRGASGAKKYLQGKLSDKPESYNMSISKYIGTKMMGGHGFAGTANAQKVGLNNQNYDSMYFPMDGYNEFEGLESGEPVYIEDEKGKKKVLRGKKNKTLMHGNVFESRL